MIMRLEMVLLCFLYYMQSSSSLLFIPKTSVRVLYNNLNLKYHSRTKHHNNKNKNRKKHQAQLTMRDRSAVSYFKVGDTVLVIEDVYKNKNLNLNGYKGIVKETWEKCQVDPTCCCAEQVDLGMAVTVVFDDENKNDSFLYYFAEDELVKVN